GRTQGDLMKSRITVEIATSCRTSRISEKSAASAKDLKNPQRRIVLVNDLLQIGFSPALLSSSQGSQVRAHSQLANLPAHLLSYHRRVSIVKASVNSGGCNFIRPLLDARPLVHHTGQGGAGHGQDRNLSTSEFGFEHGRNRH